MSPRIKIELTQDEAIDIVGCLKVLSKFDGGNEKLDQIANRISKAHLNSMKEEMINNGNR